MRKLIALLGFGALTLGMGACTTLSDADEIYLYYKDGSVEGKGFQECIPPNDGGPFPIDDHVYQLPTSLRTWNIQPAGGDTSTPVTAGSRPDSNGQAGPQVHVWATIEFFLNTYCGSDNKDASSPVVQFWEKTGRRYGVSDDGGFNEEAWVKMLQNTLIPVLNKTVQQATRDYSADELDSDLNGAWRKVEQQMQTGDDAFNTLLKDKVGGDYFCGINFDRTKADCPPVKVTITDVSYADPQLQAARTAVRVSAETAKQRLIEAQSKVDVAKKEAEARAANPDYTRLRELEVELEIARLQAQAAEKCAANPTCTVVIAPGTGVNINR